jgi:F0F1-type ATP synthase membrane subunit b/b'
LRISLSAAHTEAHVDALLAALREYAATISRAQASPAPDEKQALPAKEEAKGEREGMRESFPEDVE